VKFRRHVQLEHGLKQIDIAPLIDIIFQLLIFFMLTSSFIMQPGIKVNLPKAVTSQVLKEQNIIILISSEDVIYIDNKVYTIKELRRFLEEKSKIKPTILIKSDRRSTLGTVVEVWDLCREVGFNQINIATDTK